MILIATQCFPPTFGGIENYVGGLADTLAESGQDVVVLADGASDAGDASRPYRVQRFGGPKLVRRLKKRSAAARLLRGDVSRVFVDSYKSIAAIPPRCDAKLICLAHGMEFPSAPRASKAARMRRLMARADLILANSHYTADLARPYIADTARLAVATPPLPPQPDPTPDAVAAIADQCGAGRPLIVSLARLEPRKGVDQLIRALSAVSEAHPGALLAVAGGGPDRTRLETLAAAEGVADRCRFLGRVSEAEKAALFARADIFAMPVRREGDSVEGFGIVYLEAAWHGAPSLAGRDGGAGDAVLDGETGRLCEGADLASVRTALLELLADPDRLVRMRRAAQDWARSQLWRARIADYLES